jgi:hypothetical protein
MLIRLGLRLSVLTLVAIWLWFIGDYVLGNHSGRDLSWYLAYGFAVFIPTLALIWLGVFAASVVRKGSRLARPRERGAWDRR